MKILILCTGNSCRSQMAHGFLQSFDPNLEVFSAGTIDISHHIPTNVSEYINESWDYVITVCDHARETCPVFQGNVKKQLHIGFDDPSEAQGTDEWIKSEFIRVRKEIKNAFFAFYLTEIKKLHIPTCTCQQSNH